MQIQGEALGGSGTVTSPDLGCPAQDMRHSMSLAVAMWLSLRQAEQLGHSGGTVKLQAAEHL